MDKTGGISIIVPFLNECEGIELFCKTYDEYKKEAAFDIELVFVDDGSTDGTGDILSNYEFQNIKKVKLVTLSKNYGSHAAIRAGIQNAYYDICTWMGSDLQEPIELIKLSYQKIMEGYDAVYIEKKTIKVSKLNRFFSKMYSHLIRKYAVDNYSKDGVSVIVFNEKIKDMLNQNIESNSSIILQIMDAGFRNYSYSMDFHERTAGHSKWTMKKKIKVFIDSFISFSFMPIRLVSVIGLFMFLIGIVIGIFTLVNKFVNPDVPIGYSTLACIISMGFGVTNISLGIIAEYLWRAYDAARKRPVFLISDVKSLTNRDEEG